LSASRQTNWANVLEAVKIELENFAAAGYKPTLRAMYYRLYSKNLIPNTKSAYDRLGRVTSRAREEEELDMDCFSDNSRQVLGGFNEQYWTPHELIEARIERLKNSKFDYQDFIPRWYNQPHYVEVWTEKDAMTPVFQNILEDYQVRIVPMRGNPSWTFLNECAKRISHFFRLGKQVHILYYGDFDPTGDFIDTDITRRLGVCLDLSGTNIDIIDFQRVAVTPEQIEEHDLPFDPDKTTREKLEKRDSHTNGFVEKYGKLYATELDALPALIPDIFKQELVIAEVDQYFRGEIYQELIEKYKPEDIYKLLKTQLKRLSQTF